MDQDIQYERENHSILQSDVKFLRETIICLQEQLRQLQISTETRCEVLQTSIEQVAKKAGDTSEPSNTGLRDVSKKDFERNERIAALAKGSYVKEFCTSISLPGVSYIVEKDEPKLHKWLWATLHLAALLISASYIQTAYHHWQSSPIVLSFNNSLTRVDKIPFPAVTVCERFMDKYLYKDWYPPEEVQENCIENATWVCSDEELRKTELASSLLPMYWNDTSIVKLEQRFRKLFNPNTTFGAAEYLAFVERLKLKGNYKFSWNGVESHTFSPLMPEINFSPGLGIIWCETFNDFRDGPKYLENNLKSELKLIEREEVQGTYNWTPENMMTDESRNYSGLLYTKNPVHTYVIKSVAVKGSDPIAFIGNPAEHTTIRSRTVSPDGKHGIQIPTFKVTKLVISPKLVTAGVDLFDTPLPKRGCAFSYEIKLSLFKFFTRNNCIFECQLNCALDRCGCILQNMPVFNSSVRVCGYFKNEKCQNITNHLDYDLCGCNCPQDCISLTYEVSTDITSQGVIRKLWLEYKDVEFETKFRYSITDTLEFIAYSLGILGVFNGFSLMFVWEVLYWLTLRLWSTIGRTLRC